MTEWENWKERQGRCEDYYSEPLDDTYQHWNNLLTNSFSKFCSIEGTILDVGCGDPERSTKYFSGEYSYIGLDPNIETLTTRLPLIMGVSEHLPLRTGVFDHVALMSLLDHVADPASTMREAKRVLKTRGDLWLLLLIWSSGFSLERDPYHLKHFSMDDLREILLNLQHEDSLSIPYKEDFRRVLFLKLRKKES